MNVYVDHNFLIYCAKEAAWRKAVIGAHQSERICVILSAWHFYEYGNASGHPGTEDLIKFAEELNPKWILERGDLQQREFIAEWNNLWDGEPYGFDPICSLAEAGAALNRVSVQRMSRYTIREYVASFSAPGALDTIRAELERQKDVAKFNLDKYVNDKRFDAILPITQLFYVAVQIARLSEIKPDRVYALANELMRQQPIATQIECFVYWKGLELLKAYLVEVALTLDLYPNKATLNVNRQVDRQHAIVALPYCDILVTDDDDLAKRCNRVKQRLKFKTADIITGKELIDSL
jgi:hypothetical protein